MRFRHLQLVTLLGAAALSIAATPATEPLPWAAAGLGEREAAAHLLDRFGYGPRPGDVDAVLAMGLETWLDAQLDQAFTEPELDERLAHLQTTGMSSREIAETYPGRGMLLRELRARGIVPADFDPEGMDDADRRRLRRDAFRYASEQGYRRQQELLDELTEHKLLRSIYAHNQLAEVVTDFWFNHFNVSISDEPVRQWVLQYERDAIRPHALGDFRDLLGATARHPAMLLYLDNFMSVADEAAPTTLEWEAEAFIDQVPTSRTRRSFRARFDDHRRRQQRMREQNPNRPSGLNENYARELLELHTLGVDGGYGQDDVIEVARAFTGWSVLPPGDDRRRAEQRLERARAAGGLGFVLEENFVFRADAHDAGAKTVLGVELPAGRGVEDGEEVLDLVAAHPSTARHIARKLAVRFVSDEPSDELVDRLAGEFLISGGDTATLIRAIASAPEFWQQAARHTKIKSPLELTVSAVRTLDAEVENTYELADWIERMGQPLYDCPAPTGFPDTADAWVNTGSLLHRMNFATELAHDRVAGIDVDLWSPDGNARGDADTIAARLLPGRDPESVLPATDGEPSAQELIELVLGSPEFQRR